MQTNELINPDAYHKNVTHKIEGCGAVAWNDPGLKRIIRLRLLSDPGFPLWDVSYCHGEMKDGTIVRVALPFFQLNKGRGKNSINAQIIRFAKADNLFVKRLGIFEAISCFC